MSNSIITIIASGLGGLGFALMCNIRSKRLVAAGVSAALISLIYMLFNQVIVNLLILNMICAILGTLYSEIMARVLKAPSTVFLIPCIIPLVPGGNLYYAMYGIITNDTILLKTNANATLLASLGIAVGIVIVSVLVSVTRKRIRLFSK